jgi:hypothetical protein
MEGLEQLVKLASFGTAGVCVLAVFIIGISIFRLPNNTSKEKVSLIKTFMNMCIIVAVICAISGGTNAYFNYNKIAEAKDESTRMQKAYEVESKKIEAEKIRLRETIGDLRNQLSSSHQLSPALSATLLKAEQRTDSLQLKPKERILEDIKANNP